MQPLQPLSIPRARPRQLRPKMVSGWPSHHTHFLMPVGPAVPQAPVGSICPLPAFPIEAFRGLGEWGPGTTWCLQASEAGEGRTGWNSHR